MTCDYCFLTATTKGTPKANGIMNSAFDNRERPHTPSFMGSYSSFQEPQRTAPYVIGKDNTERRTTIISTSASTVGFLPSVKKKRKNKCSRNCIVLLLVCFIVLSIVMLVLYLARPYKTGQESASQTSNEQKTVHTSLFEIFSREGSRSSDLYCVQW